MGKEMTAVRYVYGMAAALLMGGAAYSMTGGELAAQQPAQNARTVPVQGAPESFADLAARLQPAVVNISTRQEIAVAQRRMNDPFEQFFRRFGVPNPNQRDEEEAEPITRESGSLGSGFVISPDGYIITNNHLIQSRDPRNDGVVDEVVVTFPDRSEYEARIIGRDVESDIAVLKIEGRDLPYVNWGDSNEVRVGDWIIAIGNPFGFNGTVTAGIVSAIQRGVPQNQLGATGAQRYIQTDASINMGNSGGPMFDMAGNVVGVNSALISPNGANVGIGLAVPADQARRVADALIRGERPQRGYLGVQLQTIDDAIAAAEGLERDQGEIVDTVRDGGARDAGIRQGDIIVSVNGVRVDQDNNVSYLIANTPVGSTVPVVVIRDGERRTFNVRVGQRPSAEEFAAMNPDEAEEDDGMAAEDETPARGGEAIGMTLQPLNDQIRRALRQPSGQEGVVITRVEGNSDAARRGIQRGDIIVSVSRRPVSSPQEVASLIEQARRSGREAVLLRIRRGNTESYLAVEF